MADIPFLAMVKLGNEGGFKANAFNAPKISDEVVRNLAATAPAPNRPTTPEPGKLLRHYLGEEIGAIAPPRELVKGLIQIPGVGTIFGKFGTGKTNTCLDLGDAVLVGCKAFDHFNAEQGDVVYVAGEGLSGLNSRIQARARRRGLTLTEYRLLLVAEVPRYSNPEDWAALARTITARGVKPKLIIIDHLSIMLAGHDQNDASVATEAMQLLHALANQFECTVLIIAHAGKDGEREVRGSSAFLDNVDFALELTTEGAS